MSRALVRPSGETIGRPRRGGLYIWALAVLVGALAALAIIVFRTLITYAEFLAFGAAAGRMSSHLAALPWWSRLISFTVGGALIALFLRLGISMGWGPAPRVFGLDDVVQHRRLRGTIRLTTLSLRDSFLSSFIAVISLGWGGSAGREEPAAHLGASLAMLPGRLLALNAANRRMLVGMGVAAAIAAVLHAPITAVILARELVLRRFRLSALGPIVVASVTSWLLTSTHFEGRPVIAIPTIGAIPPQFHVAAVLAVPVIAAFAWGAVVLWTRLPGMIAAGAGRIRLPLWLLPALGGPLLGVLAMAFPQALGIGYEPLAAGLGGNYSALLMPVLALAKIAATSMTLSFRWGGGPIAPALYVGAMLGSSLGVVAGLALGDASSAQVYFGVVGMAVSLAVLLNTPFAAAMLALELSGSPQIGAACLVFAFIASMGVRRLSPPAGEETEQTLRWR